MPRKKRGKEIIGKSPDNGQFLPGNDIGKKSNPVGRPLGGRVLALQTLDAMLAKPENQKRLLEALQARFKSSPVRFFQEFIMPLLPKTINMENAFPESRLNAAFHITVNPNALATIDGATGKPLEPDLGEIIDG